MTRCIMMVDDDPEALRMYRNLFERRGFVMLGAPDANSALEMLQESAPDIFILDVMMPEVNGVQLCQQIRELPEHAHTPVLILSAWGDPKTVEATFAAGANDYLVKPITPQRLQAKVNELLDVPQREPASGPG